MCEYEHQAKAMIEIKKRARIAYPWSGWVCSHPNCHDTTLFLTTDGKEVLAVPIGRVCWVCYGLWTDDSNPCMGKDNRRPTLNRTAPAPLKIDTPGPDKASVQQF